MKLFSARILETNIEYRWSIVSSGRHVAPYTDLYSLGTFGDGFVGNIVKSNHRDYEVRICEGIISIYDLRYYLCRQ